MNEKHMPCAYWRPGDKCALDEGVDDFCVLGPCTHAAPSRGDRLRRSSDYELAEFLSDNIDCEYCLLKKQGCRHGSAACVDMFLKFLQEVAP